MMLVGSVQTVRSVDAVVRLAEVRRIVDRWSCRSGVCCVCVSAAQPQGLELMRDTTDITSTRTTKNVALPEEVRAFRCGA